jgi:integrase
MPSVKHNKKTNKYKIIVYGGYDEHGNQRKKKLTWTPPPELRTKHEIQKELDKVVVALQEQCDNETVTNGSIKFSAFVDLWLERYAYKHLKPTSIDFYNTALTRILPAIGNVKLEDLNRRHIDRLYVDLEEKGTVQNLKYVFTTDMKAFCKQNNITYCKLAREANVSEDVLRRLDTDLAISHKSYNKLIQHIDKSLFKPINADQRLAKNTVRHHHRTLNAILQKAVKWGYIDENPCNKVEAPREERKEAAYLDDNQILLLLSLLDNEPEQYRMMIKLFVFSGMRRGEVCGLKWEDINFNDCVISVCRESLYLTGKGTYEEDGKTKSARRDFMLPQELFELLRKYKVSQTEKRLMLGDQWIDTGYIFTQQNGKPLYPGTISAWFGEFIKRHNLEEDWKGIHIHSLRHSNASLLISKNIPLTTIAHRLGHANPTVTTAIYSHHLKSVDTLAADVLADTFFNKKEGIKVHV